MVEHTGTIILYNSVFIRDLIESNVTTDLVLSDKLFETVLAVKLKAVLDITSSLTMLGVHKR